MTFIANMPSTMSPSIRTEPRFTKWHVESLLKGPVRMCVCAGTQMSSPDNAY